MTTDDEIKYKYRNQLGKLGLEKVIDKMLKEARTDERLNLIARLRVIRSSMCLKDREILLKEINKLNEEI